LKALGRLLTLAKGSNRLELTIGVAPVSSANDDRPDGNHHARQYLSNSQCLAQEKYPINAAYNTLVSRNADTAEGSKAVWTEQTIQSQMPGNLCREAPEVASSTPQSL
jgi:hypothetical protein